MLLSIGAVCKAGQSKTNGTGTWRALAPIVAAELCNGCGICERFCPDGCIVVQEGQSCVDYFYCKGCGICENECPRAAIRMETEAEPRA